jgi:glutathione S-transferase
MSLGVIPEYIERRPATRHVAVLTRYGRIIVSENRELEAHFAAKGLQILHDAPSAEVVLFGADTPNTWKVAGVLEEMGRESQALVDRGMHVGDAESSVFRYDVVLVDLAKNEQKEPWFVDAINPNGRTPGLLHYRGEQGGGGPNGFFSAFESGAICSYLVRAFPELCAKVVPQNDELALSRELQWLFWQCAHLGPTLGQLMYFRRIAGLVGH